ncbi:MAG: helix-turn-helix domain-containing protein [Henriciella sp.]
MSRASLYRMFQRYDGVRSYITQRRSVRAIIEIAAPPKIRGALRRAAERWGFSTQPNFNRTINKLFGAPPSKLQPVKSEFQNFTSEGAQILEEFAELTAIAA